MTWHSAGTVSDCVENCGVSGPAATACTFTILALAMVRLAICASQAFAVAVGVPGPPSSPPPLHPKSSAAARVAAMMANGRADMGFLLQTRYARRVPPSKERLFRRIATELDAAAIYNSNE